MAVDKIHRASDKRLREQILDRLSTLETSVLAAITAAVSAAVSDTAYDATTWDGVTTVAPSKNAVRDKLETIVSNVTHTGEVTGATTLTVDKTAISNRSTVTVAPTDTILIGDASDSDNLKKIVASDFATAAQANATHTGEVTGATTLTVDKTAISNRSVVTPAALDYALIGDASNSDALAKVTLQSIGGLYRPGVMQYNGTTGRYSGTFTSSGNKVTTIARFRISSFTGGGTMRLVHCPGPGSARLRVFIAARASDFSDADQADKIVTVVQNSAGTNICFFVTPSGYLDGNLHTIFFSFDGDIGASTFIVDGVSGDDAGNADRVAPTTGTLETGASTPFGVGASTGGTDFVTGVIGFCGHRQAYLTNWTDFMNADGSPKQLNEALWTEWGAQPLYFNPHGQMDNNRGSAASLTKSGTVLVSFEEFRLSTGLVV